MLSFDNYCGWVPRLQMRGVFDARSGSAAKHLRAPYGRVQGGCGGAADLVGPLGVGSVCRFESAHGQKPPTQQAPWPADGTASSV
jgi:hypothetical protein